MQLLLALGGIEFAGTVSSRFSFEVPFLYLLF